MLPTPVFLGFSCDSAGKESIHLQCWRSGFDPWIGKIPQRRESLLTPVFWLREFHGLRPCGCKESETTEQLFLSLSHEYSTRRKTEGSCKNENRLHSFLVANHIYGGTLIKQITLVSSGKRIGLTAERCGRWACHRKVAAASHVLHRICDLQRRGFWSRVRDKAWLLGAFCVAKFY